jgi:hypothetical protein
MKKKATARHLIIITEDAIEVTIKEHSDILSIDSINMKMMKRRKRNNLILMQCHLNMIYHNGNITVPHPKKLIQCRILL